MMRLRPPLSIGTQGIDVEGQPRLASSALDKQFKNEGEVGEDVEIDQTRSWITSGRGIKANAALGIRYDSGVLEDP
jgi:hypothetical protein